MIPSLLQNLKWEEDDDYAYSFSGFTVLHVNKVGEPARQALCIKSIT